MVLSLRSRRKRKAWGVSPRELCNPDVEPATAGDRIQSVDLSLAIASSGENHVRIPGAYAPGFMLHACFAGWLSINL